MSREVARARGWPVVGLAGRTAAHALAALPDMLSQDQLEARLPELPGALGFGLGAALAELQGLVGAASPQGWLKAPAPALLLPAGEAMLLALEGAAASMCGLESCTLKWKVATAPDALERQLLDQLLQRLPVTGTDQEHCPMLL